MKYFLLVLLFTTGRNSFSQKVQFTLHGKFKTLTPKSHLYIAYNDERRFDTLSFPVDGILWLSGTLTKAGTIQLMADSSLVKDYVWVDGGNIDFTCEEQNDKKHPYFNLTIVNGSEDTKLLYQMTDLSIQRSQSYHFPPEMSKEKKDSIMFYDYPYRIIDSLIQKRPNSPIIPFYISFYSKILGPPTVEYFYNELPQETKESDEGQSVNKFLLRSSLLKAGTAIKDFSMMDDKGNMLSLNSIQSNYIILDFWASWCGPCRAENSRLVKLYDLYKDKGLAIISISLDEKKDDWLKAIKTDGLKWYNISDLKGRQGDIVKKYKIGGIPFIVLLDKEKKVIKSGVYLFEIENIFSASK